MENVKTFEIIRTATYQEDYRQIILVHADSVTDAINKVRSTDEKDIGHKMFLEEEPILESKTMIDSSIRLQDCKIAEMESI